MKARSALLLAAVVVTPVAAAVRGASGPLTVTLDLGPGDAPYVSGFLPDFEIVAGTTLHWSRPAAVVDLPLAFSGPAELFLRFGPPPGGPSRIDVVLGEQPLGGFECCRHRALQRRGLDATLAPSESARGPAGSPSGRRRPVRIGLSVVGEEVRDLGLLLDRVDLQLESGARMYLAGAARFRGAALVGLALVALILAGFGLERALLLVAPLSAALAVGMVRDPWLVHRLLSLIPETLLFVVVPAAAFGRLVVRRGSQDALRAAVCLSIVALVGRGAALNHPRFYYPDLMVHARLVAVAREAGSDLLVSPYAVLYSPRSEPRSRDTLVRATSGLWLRHIGGVDLGLPYSLLPHALLAPLASGLDETMALVRMAGTLWSAAAVAILCFVAGRLGLSPWVGALLVLAPTPLVELSLGAVPAVFGHVAEVALLLWLLGRASGAAGPYRFAEGAIVLAVAQLAYVSTLLTSTAVFLGLAALRARRDPTSARALFLSTLGGSGLAVALYYRDFWPAAFTALRLSLSGTPLSGPPGLGGGADAGLGRVDASFLAFAVALAGPAIVGLRGLARAASKDVLVAWAGAVCLFLLLRAGLGGLFGFVHLATFATPLLCLAAGGGLTTLGEGTRGRKASALALLLLIGAVGLGLQGLALAQRLAPGP